MPTNQSKQNLATRQPLISRLRPGTGICFAAALILGLPPLATAVSAAAQNGPPSTGSSSAVLFTPATLGLVAGLNGPGYSGNGGLATAAQPAPSLVEESLVDDFAAV